MKKRILLIGAIYYRNLGDAALCYAARGLLSEHFEVSLLDIYGRTEFPPVPPVSADNCRKEYKHIVRRIRLRDLLLRFGIVPFDSRKKQMFERVEQQLTEEIEREKPAAIVFAGGALLKGVFLNSIERIVAIAERFDIPVLFNACGVDAAMRPAEWEKLGSILRNRSVRYVSVRDGYPLLRAKFPDVELHETFDPALCAGRFFRPAAEKKGIGLGIMLSHNFDFEMQSAFWGRLMQKLNAEGREWRLFTNGAPADQNFAAYLLRENRESGDRLMSCPVTPEDLYRTISSFEGIVSMRLHSHILAYASGTPSVAVSWDRKLDDFFAKIEKPENCLTFSAGAEEILRVLDASLADADAFRGQAERERQVDTNIAAITETIVSL